MNKRKGDEAEALALAHLEARGLRRLGRNHRSKRGEIDIVMRDGEELVFVEVRRRTGAAFGGGAASVTASKQRRLRLAAEHYRLTHPRERHRRCRFDVVVVDGAGPDARLEWLRNAF